MDIECSFGLQQSLLFKIFPNGTFINASSMYDSYMCLPKDPFIFEPFTRIKSFIGHHKSGKGDSDVDALVFLDCCRIHYFPRGLNRIFLAFFQIFESYISTNAN